MCTGRRAVSFLCVLTILSITVLLRMDSRLFLRGHGVLQGHLPVAPQRVVGKTSKVTVLPATQVQQTTVAATSLTQDAFWMAVSYTGQMTSCVADLLSIQCFARALDPQVHIVEPFLDTGSSLGTHSFHLESGSQESLKLYDLYDKAEWNNLTSSYAPVVSWNHFIHNAPRKLIIVDPHCGKVWNSDCHTKELQNLKALLENRYGFEIVNTVYFRNASNKFSVHEYKRLLYGQYSPQDVVVLFDVWGARDFRKVDFKMESLKCKHVFRDMPASRRIKTDALTYSRKYMSTDSYISVMVRFERFYLGHIRNKEMSQVEVESLLSEYCKAIVKKVENLRQSKNVSSVFLMMDCTDLGSKFFTGNQKNPIKRLLISSATTLFEMIYGNSSSLKQWDEGFYDASSSRNKGYIAQMQKYLAANGTCLVLAGGGTFQKTASELHKQLHPSNACVNAVKYQH